MAPGAEPAPLVNVLLSPGSPGLLRSGWSARAEFGLTVAVFHSVSPESTDSEELFLGTWVGEEDSSHGAGDNIGVGFDSAVSHAAMLSDNNNSNALGIRSLGEAISHCVGVDFLENWLCKRVLSDACQLGEPEDFLVWNITDEHSHLHWNEMVWADTMHQVPS